MLFISIFLGLGRFLYQNLKKIAESGADSHGQETF